MTITLAVHPRCGQEVTVVMDHGKEAIRVESDDGRRFLVATAWTSASPRAAPLAWEGRAVRLDPRVLLTLSRWVLARGQRPEPENCKEVDATHDAVDNNPDAKGLARGDELLDAVVGEAGPSGPGRRAMRTERGG